MYTERHQGKLLIIHDSNAGIGNYVTNMTSSVMLLSDECHEETAIMSSHSYQSMVIAKLKVLQLVFAYLSKSSLEGGIVITEAHRYNGAPSLSSVENMKLWDRATRNTVLQVMIQMSNLK